MASVQFYRLASGQKGECWWAVFLLLLCGEDLISIHWSRWSCCVCWVHRDTDSVTVWEGYNNYIHLSINILIKTILVLGYLDRFYVWSESSGPAVASSCMQSKWCVLSSEGHCSYIIHDVYADCFFWNRLQFYHFGHVYMLVLLFLNGHNQPVFYHWSHVSTRIRF